MNNNYKGFKNLQKASVNQRLVSAQEVIINRLGEGAEIDFMKSLKPVFDKDGQYEFSTAIDLVIPLYKMNPFSLN